MFSMPDLDKLTIWSILVKKTYREMFFSVVHIDDLSLGMFVSRQLGQKFDLFRNLKFNRTLAESFDT